MLSRAATVALTLILAPPAAYAADLVVWWEEGFYPEEDDAVREMIAAFNHDTEREVELAFFPQAELPGKIVAAIEASQPPDFAFGTQLSFYVSKWAFDDRLVDLANTVGHLSDLFDPEALASWTLLNQETGQRACMGCRWVARPTTSTSGRAYWSWPASPLATSRMSGMLSGHSGATRFSQQYASPPAVKTSGAWALTCRPSPLTRFQFLSAYDANYVTQDGRRIIDDPRVRRRLIESIEAYTAIYLKGCTPPSSIDWKSNLDNNKQFHAQRVVIVLNDTLSIPNALKRERPEDYYKNTATIEWPVGPDGEAYAIYGGVWGAVVFKDGGHLDAAKEFVRFLVAEGWLAHYLDFAGERFLPPMQKLREQPLWLDLSDPHRMSAVMQIASRPTQHNYIAVSGDWRYNLVWQELVWAKAVHRVAAEGVTPEQAVDEAIARIKQILAE